MTARTVYCNVDHTCTRTHCGSALCVALIVWRWNVQFIRMPSDGTVILVCFRGCLRAVCDCCCVVDFHIQIRITLLTLNRNRNPLIGRVSMFVMCRERVVLITRSSHLIRLRLTLRQNGGCTEAVRVRCQNRVRGVSESVHSHKHDTRLAILKTIRTFTSMRHIGNRNGVFENRVRFHVVVCSVGFRIREGDVPVFGCWC